MYDTNAKKKTALKQPMAKMDFYKDVAVVAFKTNKEANSFQEARPEITINGSGDASYLTDGCSASYYQFKPGDQLTFAFKNPHKADKITILPRRPFMWENPDYFSSSFRLSSSEDGKEYSTIKEFTIIGLNSNHQVEFKENTAQFFRLELTSISQNDAWIPFEIAECEILSGDEEALFSPKSDHLMAKTGSVKAGSMSDYESSASYEPVDSKYEVLDLTSKMDEKGILNWKPEDGNWTVIRFGYTTTGATNAPATPEGIGLECDKMEREAVKLHFDSFPAKLIEKA